MHDQKYEKQIKTLKTTLPLHYYSYVLVKCVQFSTGGVCEEGKYTKSRLDSGRKTP